MLNDEQIKAIQQLKAHPLFAKIFACMVDKYKKTGKYTGKIVLTSLTSQEQLFLSAIDVRFMEQSAAAFTTQQFFKKKVCTGILQGVEMAEFWDAYHDKRPTTNAEIRADFHQARQQFFDRILAPFEQTNGGDWLAAALCHKKFGYKLLIKEYAAKDTALAEMLSHVLTAINQYPANRFVTFPVFSAEITKNPHYFDYGTTPFHLLAHGFCFLSGEDFPTNAEGFQSLMASFGLVKDLVSNQILTYHVSAFVKGCCHEGVEQFCNRNEILALTLKNINDYDRFTVQERKLFVFENPSVFSAIAEEIGERTGSLLCTSGNIKLSAIAFLDKAVPHCDCIFYSGDFDPEGLRIADYLKNRYGGKLRFWRMSEQDYLDSMSHVSLDEARIKKLDSLRSRELIEIAARIRAEKKAGYQERLLERYAADVDQIANLTRTNSELNENKFHA